MRTLLSLIVWLYFLPGLVLGAILFGVRSLEAAMAAPELDDLAEAIAVALIEGVLRVLYWLPSLYDQVVLNNVPVVAWVLS